MQQEGGESAHIQYPQQTVFIDFSIYRLLQIQAGWNRIPFRSISGHGHLVGTTGSGFRCLEKVSQQGSLR